MEIIPVYSANEPRKLLALLHQFGICEHQDASSEERKDGCHLVQTQSYTSDV
jgi:hypothetical protein